MRIHTGIISLYIQTLSLYIHGFSVKHFIIGELKLPFRAGKPG